MESLLPPFFLSKENRVQQNDCDPSITSMQKSKETLEFTRDSLHCARYPLSSSCANTVSGLSPC
jgi:hypothetical protein